MSEADYTGVPTSELAELMRIRRVTSYKEFAAVHGFEERTIARIMYKESPWTNLDMADRICIALGHPGFLHNLTIIPSGYPHAARKMAEDEFWAKEIDATPAMIEKRAKELRALRAKLIKEKKPQVVKKTSKPRNRSAAQVEANRQKQRDRDTRKKVSRIP